MASGIGNDWRGDVLLAIADEPALRSLAPLLRLGGFAVRRARSQGEALAEIAAALPDLLVADAELPDGTGFGLVEALRQLPGGGEPAVVLLGPRGGRCDRGAAIYCGADATLDRPIVWGDLARQLDRLHGGRKAARVLMVEDDHRQAAFIGRILAAEGYDVRWCDDPLQFATVLEDFRPDLVLMDVLLPGTTGYDLVRALRGNERHANLPVLFLTTEAQIAARIEVVRAGGDEHLTKPVAAQLLVSAVGARIERGRQLRRLIDSDGLTRLLTPTAFLERARAMTAAGAPGSRRQAVWVTIDLDHFKTINDRFGHAAGDRVLVTVAAFLRRHVRARDVVGRCGGEELGLLFEDLQVSDVLPLVDRLRREFAGLSFPAEPGPPFTATWSAGIASLLPGMGWEEWRQAADLALYAAKHAGRNQVALAPEPEALSAPPPDADAAPPAAIADLKARASRLVPPGPGPGLRVARCEPWQAEAP
jgi:diguanylate cyclase (GGDEF)-like protein